MNNTDSTGRRDTGPGTKGLLVLAILVILGIVGCASPFQSPQRTDPKTIGQQSRVFLRVRDRRPIDVQTRSGDPKPASLLQTRVQGVLEELGFQPSTQFEEQRRLFLWTLQELNFHSVGAFGQVELQGSLLVRCQTPEEQHSRTFNYAKSMSASVVEKARDNPAEVRREQMQAAVPELLERVFKDTRFVACLAPGIRTGQELPDIRF